MGAHHQPHTVHYLSLFHPNLHRQVYERCSLAFYVLIAKGMCNINYKYAQIAVIGVIVVLSVANLQLRALINGSFSCAPFAFFTQYY